MQSKLRGFTMIEVLVVIGITGALLAILIPTVAGVRERAARVKCQSNLRQLATGAQTRAGSSGGYIPLGVEVRLESLSNGQLQQPLSASLQDAGRRRYLYLTDPFNPDRQVLPPPQTGIAAELGVRLVHGTTLDFSRSVDAAHNGFALLQCPADANRESVVCGTPTYVNNVLSEFVINLPSSYGWNAGVIGFHSNPAYQSRRGRGNLQRLLTPASVVLLFDAVDDLVPTLAASPGPVSLADAVLNNGRVERASVFDRIRHRGRVTVAFADGHVEVRRISADDLADCLASR